MTAKNALASETSPYLRQHESNPVDWHPWGERAFAKARRENKPVFLSIGYSTCHWCHVMAHESFENADVAAVLNEYFVSIKVDREERPDVDRLYMAFVQGTTGSGGWPMSVWLTPEAQPFFGGTYFPPTDRYGRPGFVTVLERIAELWFTGREQLLAQAADVVQALVESNTTLEVGDIPGQDALVRAADAFVKSFDSIHGGFGGAPKFPRPSVLNFLFRRAHSIGLTAARDDVLHVALHTLRKMDAGGMHDQIGGGFHRYSVDAQWHVPHFEKMLYDQAQLVNSFLDAWLISGDDTFLAPVRDTLDYVQRNLTHAEGGFFSAEDADSLREPGNAEHAEGAFYVWSQAEIEALLPADVSALAIRHWGVKQKGNVPAPSDPHGEFAELNILIRREGIAESASALGIPEAHAREMLEAARRMLFDARERRPRPHLDDKIITAWNGLMISAFARAGACLGEARYLNTARTAADFIKSKLTGATATELYRTWRDGIRGDIPAFAEDYAFLIQGLLDLYEAAFEIDDLRLAIDLQQRQDAQFADASGSGYFTGAAGDQLVPVRTKEDYDGAEPSASAVSAMNLLRLARMLNQSTYAEAAGRILAGFSSLMERSPTAVPQMLSALELYHSTPQQLVIAGKIGAPDALALAVAARTEFAPDASVMLADGAEGQEFLARHVDGISAMTPLRGVATLYRCANFTCQTPVTFSSPSLPS